jgi:urease accessory protein
LAPLLYTRKGEGEGATAGNTASQTSNGLNLITLIMLTDQSLLRILQLTDSTFPTGAFAHSFGLETYVARGIIRTVTTLEEFITHTLLNAIASSDGVACVAMMRAGPDWQDLVQRLDGRLSAMKVVTESRQASRALGTRFLRTTTALFSLPRATNYLSAVDAATLYGHISLAYGLVCHDLDLPVSPALVAWFRHYCASMVSVGVRLIPLGQTAGQELLARLGAPIRDAVALALERDVDDMASFAPGQELAGIMHRDVLTTRLYIS